MRILPRRWNQETLSCGFSGHITPAGGVRHLRPGDRALGVELADGTRFVRCVRCDTWLRSRPEDRDRSDGPCPDHLPPLDELDLPPTGVLLRDVIVVRAIAVIRGFHSLAFATLAVGLGLLMTDLGRVQQIGDSLRRTMDVAVDHTGQQASRSFITDTLGDIDALRPHALRILFASAVVYAVLEGVEAFGLWRQRRWAEYLTVVATAGFVPFEIASLADRITAPRVGALVVNLVILGWLVWSKRLFGLRGGTRRLEERRRTERERRLASL